jgi:hypothetical protein
MRFAGPMHAGQFERLDGARDLALQVLDGRAYLESAHPGIAGEAPIQTLA